jgi:hypothetical protein
MMQLTDEVIGQLNEWEGFMSVKPTWLFDQLLLRSETIIALFTGNQWGKNTNIIKQYVMRWLGIHPIEVKNIRPSDTVRTYRFCSEVLPNDPNSETKNTIYPVIKRMVPKSLILQDVSIRKPTMVLKDVQGGEPIILEFVSYNQDVQTQAGTQRKSVYIDERCSREFYTEQLPRLLRGRGDLIIGMTPALGQITWQFEDIYEGADCIVRTQKVLERYAQRFGEYYKPIHKNNNHNNIAVLMAATDDNPVYQQIVDEVNKRERTSMSTSDYITNYLGVMDEETMDIRRYGIFRQIHGRIFRDFDSMHIVPDNLFGLGDD